MFLTEEQLHELQSIIGDAHSAFVANYIAPQAIPAETLQQLHAVGAISPKAATMRDAYSYGVLATLLRDRPDLSNGTYEQLVAAIRANPIPKSAVENQAIAIAQMSAGQYIQGIGVRMAQAVGSQVMQTDAEARADLQERIQRVVTAGIDSRASLQEVASNLGHETQDWTRDLRRVANTEVASAMNEGAANAIAKKYGPDARVAILSAPSCCDRCLELFDGGGKPIIFKLFEIRDAGTNVGRKQSDWVACMPPLHPHCRCRVQFVPVGFGFNEQRQMVPESLIRSEVHFPASIFREPAVPVFFTKAEKGEQVPGHTYATRTGSPGHYHYAYGPEHHDEESRAAIEHKERMRVLEEYQDDSKPIQSFAAGESNHEPGTGGHKYMQAKIDHLDEAMRRGHFRDETVLWRGAQSALVKSLRAGDTYQEPAYMSTTHEEGVAARFSKYPGENQKYAAILRIKLPAKHPALDVPTHLPHKNRSQHDDGENEVLLPRNMRFNVVSVKQHPLGPPLIELEVIDGKP